MSETPTDWVAVHRRILDSAVGSEDELLGLFTRVLLCVNWKRGFFKGLEVEPGQMIFAWRKLRERLYPNAVDGPSKNTIEKRLRCLEALGVLKIEPHKSKRFSILTVPKWSKYQPNKPSQNLGTVDSEPYPKSGTVLGTVPGTVLGTDRRRDNKGKKTRVARSRFKPPTAEEVKAYCQDRGNDINAERFVDYYETRAWKLKGGQAMKCWKAAVRTWEGNGLDRQASQGSAAPVKKITPIGTFE